MNEKLKNSKKYILILILAAVFIYAAYEYYDKYFYVLKDPNKIKQIIIGYGKFSIAAFFGLQVLQVVVFFIPGEIIQVAGGYIFGTFWGSVISLLGITAGSAVTYYISNRLGKPFVAKLLSHNDKSKFSEKYLNSYKGKYGIFLIYLIPGLPKDIVGYICGISNIEFKNFIIYSTLGRIPGIFISAYFGSQIYAKDVAALIIIAVTMSILFLIGVFKGEKIINAITKKHR